MVRLPEHIPGYRRTHVITGPDDPLFEALVAAGLVYERDERHIREGIVLPGSDVPLRNFDFMRYAAPGKRPAPTVAHRQHHAYRVPRPAPRQGQHPHPNTEASTTPDRTTPM